MNKIYIMFCFSLITTFSASAMDNGVDPDEVEEVVLLDDKESISCDKLKKTLYKFRDVGNKQPWALVWLHNYCSRISSKLYHKDVLKKHKLLPLDNEMEAIARSAIMVKSGLNEVLVKTPLFYDIEPPSDEVKVQKIDDSDDKKKEKGWHIIPNYLQQTASRVGTMLGNALSGDVPDPIFDALRAQGVTTAGLDESEIA